MQTKFIYSMNAIAKDIVSGFQGTIIGRTAHLFGCSQYGLAPQDLASDGTPKATEYFDESRIEIIDNSAAVEGENNHSVIFPVPLGSEIVDKVSGFKGKVLVAVESLHNCNQYHVGPPVDKENKIPQGEWFDEGRLTIIGQGIRPEEVAAPKRGSLSSFSRDLPR